MHGQGPQYLSSSRVLFEIIFLATVAMAAGIGAITPWHFARIALLSAAAVGLFCNGLLTIFSIGYLELGASVLALLAVFRVTGGRVDGRTQLPLTIGGTLAAAALVMGLSLTSFP